MITVSTNVAKEISQDPVRCAEFEARFTAEARAGTYLGEDVEVTLTWHPSATIGCDLLVAEVTLR
jgi:hypothetical protein